MSALVFLFLKGKTDMKLEGQVRIPSGCAIAAVISKEGKRMSGEMITDAMKPMHDRSNGLGGGFAGYGTAMLMSYLIGRKRYPVRYDAPLILRFVLLAALLYAAVMLPSRFMEQFSPVGTVLAGTLALVAYAGYAYLKLIRRKPNN